MAKRSILRIELSPAAKEQLDGICQTHGMTQISVLSRLVNWFSSQDELVRVSVLGVLSVDNLKVLASHMLEEMAKPDKT